jgi:hypothetical protein
MGAPQMYYTSCEVGLAGYPGFQFNAATPGVDPAVLRRVEQVTSYEPPRSLGYQPTAEQIAACPVNLCYLPGGDGEPAILANTVFIGTDYSNRFGNYFVHALSLAAVEDDLGGALPIDFWRAGFWTRTEVSQPELGEARPEPPATSGPAAAEEFLQGAGRRRWLPLLLTAVDRAMTTGERSVVVVEADSERVAGWIAGVSHLLPPAMSRRLSFATYSYRPGRNAEHLVGTVPEADFVVDETTLRAYFLFDIVGGQASELTAHPLAELLTAMDAQDATDLWSLAEPLAAGAEPDFAGWYPPAAAGALRGGIPVDAGDLAAVIDWLPGSATRLRAALVSEVAHRCLAHDALTARQAGVLVGVAGTVADQELLAAAEIRAFELLVGELEEDPVTPAEVPRAATADGVRYATELITTKLNGPGGHAVALLTIAVRARLPLDPDNLDRWGRDLVAPILLAGREPGAEVPDLLHRLPGLRTAVLETLATALPEREPAVLGAMGRLGAAVPEKELEAYPGLHRTMLLARGARTDSERVPTLLRLCTTEAPDETMLATLWPSQWSVAEAAEVAAQVPARFWTAPSMVERIDQVLRRPDKPHGPWEQYQAVCELAQRHGIADRLSPASAHHVRDMLRVRRLVELRKTAAGRPLRKVVLDMLDLLAEAEGPARAYLESYLPEVFLRLGPGLLLELLPAAPEPIRRRYWQLVGETLKARQADLTVAAALIEVRAQLPGKQGLTADLDRVLAESVAQWRSKDLDQLEKWLGGKATVAYFQKWRADSAPRGIGRFLPRRRH